MIRIAICEDEKWFSQILEKKIKTYLFQEGFDIHIDCYENGQEMISVYLHNKNCFDVIF